MSSRREFLKSATILAAGTTTAASFALATTRSSAGSNKSPRIKSLALRDDTIVRHSSMNGDNWHLTWAADDRQYAGMCDGYGEFEQPPGLYNSRMIVVDGSPQHLKFQDLAGYPELSPSLYKDPRYYNFGAIALDRNIYQFLSTWPVPVSTSFEGLRFMGAKLIYSSDGGQTWRNQNGSTPVVWEDWEQRSREKSMIFFDEPQDAFSMLSVLQMGKDYSENRDGYVYIYAPNGNTEGTMNQLVMLRVPETRILDRKAYEYFAGSLPDGSVTWTTSIDDRAVVHTFPSGWVNKDIHPWAWIPSVAYNAATGVYMMANWATAPGPAPENEWFTKPSYLGFWTAPNPWGPWTQIYEDTSWTPAGDAGARCYSPIIAPKWIAKDGKSFWLVWSDYQQKMTKDELARRQKEIDNLSGLEKVSMAARLDRMNRPYYSFNLQRVDLDIA